MGIRCMTNKPIVKSAIFIILISVAIVTQNIELVRANPYQEAGTVPTDATTKPPKITLFSPLNGSVYTENTIPLSINVTLPESSTASLTIIYFIIYQADWLQNPIFLYANTGLENSIQSQMPGPEHQYFQKSLNLTDIPNGNHSITITAVAGGTYPAGSMSIYRFSINGTSTIFSNVNTQPSESPSITTTPIESNLLLNTVFAIVIITLAIVASLAMIFYFKKHHKRSS